ncbi:hypothetical protein [Salinicoccus roseus]
MKSIKSVSKLETTVSKSPWREGYRFCRNSRSLYGKPDISIKSIKL